MRPFHKDKTPKETGKAHWRAYMLLVPFLVFGSLTACLVDFKPDDYCFSCKNNEDCGEGYNCSDEGRCIPEDPALENPCP